MARRNSQNTAARKFVVARQLLEEAVERGLLSHNPARQIKGFITTQETPPTALKSEQAVHS